MEMDWEDEKGTSNVSEQEEQEEKEAEEEQHARGRPVKRRRVQHHKAITTSSASSSPERERPRRRTRVSSTTRSTRLLRHLTQPVDDAEEQPSIASARLGLQQGQPSINYRDQAKRLPLRPTADGYVYNRETGLLVEDENTYMFDDDHADVNFSYLDLAERQPDFLLAREIGGLLGIEPIDMFIASNITHLKRQADSIKDVLRKNLKARDVNVATRQRLLRDFEKQKNELGVVRTRLQQLYEVMAPTVRRWYYLASMTGYMFAPAMVPDIAMQQWADTADPLPYFLLVQHAGQQYRNYRTTDLTFSIQEDAEYWEAFDTPLFVWATEFLHEYRRQIIEARALQATLARAVGQAIYLILRDAVLSSCLRLVPPLGKAPPVGPATMAPNLRPVPVPGETYQDLLKEVNLARYTWIRPLERTRTNPRGRYQGLGYHLEHIRAFVVTTDTDETQIRQQAVTKNEARGTPFPDPFKLSGRGDPAKSAALGARLRRSNMTRVNEQNLQGAASLLAATVLSLENPVAALVPRPMQRTLAFDMLRPGALRNTVEQWTVAWNELTDALGTVSTFGMMHWQQLLRVLAPVTGATNLAHYLYEALADPGFPPPHGFTWNPDDTDPLLRSNMLCYVLLQTEDDRSPGYNRIDVRSRVMPNGYARNMFTTFNVVALPATATMAHPLALRGSTATRQQVTDNETARLLVSLIVDGDTAEGVAISRAWRKLDALFPDMSTQFAALRGAPVAGTRGNMPRIEEALRLQLMSTVAWTLLLRNKPLLVQGILDAMLQDVLALEGHAAAAQAVLAALDLETDFMAGLRSRWLPLLKDLADYTDLAAHFYREVFRSTFLSPYDRLRIHADHRITAQNEEDLLHDVLRGDVPKNAFFTRLDSGNETSFRLITWEKLYANLFHPPLAGSGYWRKGLVDLTEDTARTAAQTAFDSIWGRITTDSNSERYWPGGTLPVSDAGIPVFSELHLAFAPALPDPALVAGPAPGPGGPGPAVAPEHPQDVHLQETLYDAVAQLLERSWNQDVMNVRQYAAPTQLLQHMMVFTLGYYPRLSRLLLERQRDIDRGIAETHDFLRAVSSNDPNYVWKEVSTIMRNMYIPESEYHMSGFFTGRMMMLAFVTAAANLAYNALQGLADESIRFRASGQLPPGAPDYSHYKNVPMDVVTAFFGDGKEDAPRERDYIDIQQTSSTILGMLRSSVAFLIQQYVCEVRLQVPEQYKTIRQYERAPLTLMTAHHGMLPYRFHVLASNGPQWHVWQVTRK